MEQPYHYVLDTQLASLTGLVSLLVMPNTYQVVELHGLTQTALEFGHKLFTLLQAHRGSWEGQMQLSKAQHSCSFRRPPLWPLGAGQACDPPALHLLRLASVPSSCLFLPNTLPTPDRKIQRKGPPQLQGPEGTGGQVCHREIMKLSRSVSSSGLRLMDRDRNDRKEKHQRLDSQKWNGAREWPTETGEDRAGEERGRAVHT